MPPLPADFIHARACKLKCEKILTRPGRFTPPEHVKSKGGGRLQQPELQKERHDVSRAFLFRRDG